MYVNAIANGDGGIFTTLTRTLPENLKSCLLRIEELGAELSGK